MADRDLRAAEIVLTPVSYLRVRPTLIIITVLSPLFRTNVTPTAKVYGPLNFKNLKLIFNMIVDHKYEGHYPKKKNNFLQNLLKPIWPREFFTYFLKNYFKNSFSKIF